jgi:hypothetical protein
VSQKFQISKGKGFTHFQYHFCEPQRGKDDANRISALFKTRLRGYIDSGHDVSSAHDMHAGVLSYGGLKNLKAAVLRVETEKDLPAPSNKDFSKLHSLIFNEDTGETHNYLPKMQ